MAKLILDFTPLPHAVLTYLTLSPNTFLQVRKMLFAPIFHLRLFRGSRAESYSSLCSSSGYLSKGQRVMAYSIGSNYCRHVYDLLRAVNLGIATQIRLGTRKRWVRYTKSGRCQSASKIVSPDTLQRRLRTTIE